MGDDILAAHNASFDASVLSAACLASGLQLPDLRFLCTMAAARRCLRLASYVLVVGSSTQPVERVAVPEVVPGDPVA